MKLNPEALFGPEPLAGPTPSQVKLSPDGALASFLRPADGDRERLELWLADVRSGAVWRLLDGTEAQVSADDAAPESDQERAERERRRLFAGGVTAYMWHPRGDAIVFPARGAAFLAESSGGFAPGAEVAVRRLTPPGTRQQGIRVSPKGTYLSYARDGNLYSLRLADGLETRLTQGGGGHRFHGLPEFIAQEEMHRFDGHWWSPDEATVVFTRVDNRTIDPTRRFEARGDGADRVGVDFVTQRYPFAGAANAEVWMGLADVASGEFEWRYWQLMEDDYLARVAFGADGALYTVSQSRSQLRLEVRCRRDSDSGTLFIERSKTWINLHDNLLGLADGRLLWTSERDGASKLYVVSPDGDQRLVDAGLGRVNRILGATADNAWVTGWMDDPTTQHLFRIGLDGGECRQLTRGEAWHDGAVNAKAGVAALVRSDARTPASLQIVDLDTGAARTATEGAIGAGHPYFPYRDSHAPCEFGRLGEGVDALYYRLTKPRPFDPDRRYPVVVHVYGGPGVQRVRREFPPLVLQLFAQAGFGVFELDNRGSSNRDKAFEDVLHRRLGDVEVRDQLAGVEFLRGLPWVDATRIGVFGHSYGGYMALLCLAAGDAFAAGVSVAPVTRWELYDTHYTERYLGLPQDNAHGYAASGVLPRAADIRAPLLLMHGMADDNVLFAHSVALMQALQEAGTQFELMTYPGAKHSLQEAHVAIHRYRCILAFFRRTLAERS